MELSSLDVHYLVKELQKFVGAKVEKVVQSDVNKKDVLLTLYLKDHPKLQFRFFPPGLICMPLEKPQVYPKVPPGYAMFLRKYLRGTRLKSVEQQGFDRIVFMEFEHKETSYIMVTELLQPGNILLLEDGIIKNPLENQTFKDRMLLGRKEYVLPPASLDIFKATDDELLDVLGKSDKDKLVTSLAIDFSLGGIYAEEICLRAKADKNAKPGANKDVIKALREIQNQEINPHVNEKRAYPFKIGSSEPFEGTFANSLAQFVVDEPIVVEKGKKKKKVDIAKIQEKRIGELEKQAVESKEKADKIYIEYQLVSDILAAVNDARKNGNVKETMKKYPHIKGYSAKTNEIEVEL